MEKPMQDVQSRLSELNRPKLLVRAARHGASGYVRERHLPRLLGREQTPQPVPAALELLQLEADLDAKRTSNAADYSTGRHVDVLMALMCEAHLLSAEAAA